MGAIVSDFPQLPQDADADRVGIYTKVYESLTSLGLALPAQAPGVVTRAQLLAHLQQLAGEIIKTEIQNDPETRGYGGFTDAQIADALAREFAPAVPTRFPGTDPAGYVVTASTTAGLQATIVGGGVPNFNTILKDQVFGNLRAALYIRFRNNTTTVALRGRFGRIDDAPSADQLVFAVQAPLAPPAGNIFDVGFLRAPVLRPRLAEILRRFPFAPNAITDADVSAAKV